MKYRKKPIVVDAILWDATKKTWDEILVLLGTTIWYPGSLGSDTFYIDSLEGRMKVSKGDYVIKGIAGECYPCKPDIFTATYEPAE